MNGALDSTKGMVSCHDIISTEKDLDKNTNYYLKKTVKMMLGGDYLRLKYPTYKSRLFGKFKTHTA